MRSSRPVPVFACLALLCVGVACGSPGAKSEAASPAGSGETLDWNVRPAKRATTGKPARIKYLEYANGNLVELVNDSHTDALDAYSQRVAPSQAYTKVQTDAAVEALLERFEELEGLRKFQAGAAPVYPLKTRAKGLELEQAGSTRSWVIFEATPKAERELFLQCAQDLMALYNMTPAYRAVDQAPAWSRDPNDAPTRPPPKPGGSGSRQ